VVVAVAHIALLQKETARLVVLAAVEQVILPERLVLARLVHLGKVTTVVPVAETTVAGAAAVAVHLLPVQQLQLTLVALVALVRPRLSQVLR